jgi:hypothetical protein
MQNIIVPKPYEFVPPHRGNLAPTLIQKLGIVDAYLSRAEGIRSYEVHGIEHLRESLRLGHGILLAPNHCRYADPLAMGWVARHAQVNVYAMASWHLFHQHWWKGFAMRMCGGFSIYREGIDRQSLDTAIEILVDGERPLVVFPEGAVYRTNDQLQPLLEGVAFLARTAARRRARQNGGAVVIHPIGIKYTFRGDAIASALPVIKRIESRFTWHSERAAVHAKHAATQCDSHAQVVARVRRLEEGLLSLKELQFLDGIQSGPISQRRAALIEKLLGDVEARWLPSLSMDGPTGDGMLNRIKQLRMKMVPFLIESRPQRLPGRKPEQRPRLPSVVTESSPAELKRLIWSDLEQLYVAQQVGSYPAGYLDEPTDMRLLETVERIDEDISDRSSIHRPLHAILQVDEPISIPTDRPPRTEVDPLMETLKQRLEALLRQLSTAARPLDVD